MIRKMIYGKDHILSIEEFLSIYNSGKTLVIFGTASVADEICSIFKDLKVEVNFFADNDEQKQGTFYKGLPVIAPKELLTMKNYIVIIASGYAGEIMDGLGKLDIKDVYILHLPCLLPFSVMKQDTAELGIVLPAIKTAETTDRILLKIYDGLGDNLIKLGILKFLRECDSNGDKFWCLTDDKPNFQFFSKIFPNTFFVDKEKFEKDRTYRIEMVKFVNEMHFAKGICWNLGDNSSDFFTQYNTNIPEHIYGSRLVKWENCRTQCEHILDSMIEITEKTFDVPKNYDFTPKGILSTYLQNEKIPTELANERYIAICLGGGVSWQNSLLPATAAKVINKFIESGYKIAILGAGKKNEEYNASIKNLLPNVPCVYDYTSKLSVWESFKIIENSVLFAGIDSSMSHAAFLLDKKSVILINSSKNGKLWRHNDSKIEYVSNYNLPCAKNCVACINQKYNHRFDKHGECIITVSEEQIMQAAKKLLGV